MGGFSGMKDAPNGPPIGNCIFKAMVESVPETPGTVVRVLASSLQQQNFESILSTSNQFIGESQSSTTSPKNNCVPDLHLSSS
jgi:hypothetical protein